MFVHTANDMFNLTCPVSRPIEPSQALWLQSGCPYTPLSGDRRWGQVGGCGGRGWRWDGDKKRSGME